MTTIVLIITLIALLMMLLLAYPKQKVTQKGDKPLYKRDYDISEVVVKNRFVCPAHGQPQTTCSKPEKNDGLEKKENKKV